MFKALTGTIVFLGGFVIMVLEIVGARYLAKDFGGSFYIWVSQIGVILMALAIGYAVGGALADRLRRALWLVPILLVAGIVILLIPSFTPLLIRAIVDRHPLEAAIPPIWQKLDPAFGSAAVFFLPCSLLAVLSPYMIRLGAERVRRIGRTSGAIYAASTVGSIAGVFVSGYVLLEKLPITEIFHWMGILTIGLAGLSLWLDRHLRGVDHRPVNDPESEGT
jgi:MFS family permease